MAILVNQKPSVELPTDLPVSGNSLGDYRLIISIGRQYYWSIVETDGDLNNCLPVDDRSINALIDLIDVNVKNAIPGQFLQLDPVGVWKGAEGGVGPGSTPGATGATGPTGASGATGPITAFNFDGGSPFTDYTNGPAFDCGGVT
jgi:hypothetical protein